jgi:DNA polymerase I-like protein with 3'-5' exonuclease and polymerase domains
LQIEYAHQLGLSGVQAVLVELQTNPHADFHQVVADLCHIERTPAKTINLGLAYGMGEAKLCHSLNLPTKWIRSRSGRLVEVAGSKAAKILEQYHNFLPFMKELQEITKVSIKVNGYIKTLGGRKLFDEKPILHEGNWISFERKGLSKLIQGSAADVTIRAMINCYKAGLHVLFPVHDELCISTRSPLKDKEILMTCMEQTYDIAVPMVVEITEGQSWAS